MMVIKELIGDIKLDNENFIFLYLKLCMYFCYEIMLENIIIDKKNIVQLLKYSFYCY